MTDEENHDLNRHRTAFRLNGFPIYDDDELTGYVSEPRWNWADLSADQQAVVRQEAMRLQTNRSLEWDAAFSFMLDDYAINCPHAWVNREPAFRECRWCRTMEPLPGRLVRVGDRTMRVPEPPPERLKVPVPVDISASREAPDVAGPVVREYRWTGTSYVSDHPNKEPRP